MPKPPLKRLTMIVALAAMGSLAAEARGQGSIILDEQFPTKEKQVRVLISDDDGEPVGGASIEITYRPGSSVEKVDPIGVSEQDGSIHWIPAEAGIAQIQATWSGSGQTEVSATTSVSVRFGSPPPAGIVIMVVAGVLLVIGSAVRMFNVLRSPQAP